MKTIQILKNEKLNSILQILFFGFFGCVILFNRSFVGLYIFGFRLGEILTGVGLLISLIFLILPKKYLSNFYFNNFQYYGSKLIVLSFFLINIINNGSFTSTYTYKSSSYIWTTFFIFFGLITNLKTHIKIEYLYRFFLVVPFLTYLFSSGNYPNFVIDFFILNSDKFQFLKASDIFIGYASINFLNKYFIKSENRRFLYFMITSGLMLPLLLFASRGSFLGVVIYMLFELFYSRRYINNNRLRVGIYLLISLLFFSFSALRIDRSELNRPSFDDLVQVVNPSAVSDSISSLAEEKDTVRVFFSIG